MRGQIVKFKKHIVNRKRPGCLGSPRAGVFSGDQGLCKLGVTEAAEGPRLLLYRKCVSIVTLRRTNFSGTITSLNASLADKRTDLLGHCAGRICLACSDSKTKMGTTLHTVPVLGRIKVVAGIVGVRPCGSPSRFVGTLKIRRCRGEVSRTRGDFLFRVHVLRRGCSVGSPRSGATFCGRATQQLLTFPRRLRHGGCVRTITSGCEVNFRSLQGLIGGLTVTKDKVAGTTPLGDNVRRGGGRSNVGRSRGLLLA